MVSECTQRLYIQIILESLPVKEFVGNKNCYPSLIKVVVKVHLIRSLIKSEKGIPWKLPKFVYFQCISYHAQYLCKVNTNLLMHSCIYSSKTSFA
jgi:hypothetical protein